MKKLILIGAILIAMLTIIGLQDKVLADEVNGCYKKNNGQLRLLTNNKKCLKSEIPIILNATIPLNPAPKFDGDICFNIVQDEEPKGTLKFKVKNMSNGFYIIQGRKIENIELTKQGTFLFGGAQLVGNNIYLTLDLSHSEGPGTSERDIATFQIVLDKDTLNGTAWGIFSSYVDSSLNQQYGELTFTNITCPE